MCDDRSPYESKQFQRAIHHPMNSTYLLKNISILHYSNFFPSQISKPIKCVVCILWNIIDTFVYAIVPFLLILTSSIIIIITICQRRRSMTNIGGTCHTNQRATSAQDNLSILLIAINCLFLIMTGPFNFALIIQSISNYFSTKSLSVKAFTQLSQGLRIVQNSYHALSFIFYCVIGNKFRSSAYVICQSICCKLCSLNILRYFQRKPINRNATTQSTSFTEERKYMLNSSNTSLSKAKSFTTNIPIQNNVKQFDTHL